MTTEPNSIGGFTIGQAIRAEAEAIRELEAEAEQDELAVTDEPARKSMAPAETFRSAASKLRDPYLCNVPTALMASVATLLEHTAERYAAETTRDRPECPACDSTPGCGGHAEEDFHDGGTDRAGCEEIFAAPTPENRDADWRCKCFDDQLAVANEVHALLGEESS